MRRSTAPQHMASVRGRFFRTMAGCAVAALFLVGEAWAEDGAAAVSERIAQSDPCKMLSVAVLENALGRWMAPQQPVRRQFMPSCAVASTQDTAINVLSITLLNARATGVSMDRIQLNTLAQRSQLEIWEAPGAVVHYDPETSVLAVIHESGLVGLIDVTWTGPGAASDSRFKAALREVSVDVATRMNH